MSQGGRENAMKRDREYWRKFEIFESSESDGTQVRVLFADGKEHVGTVVSVEDYVNSGTGRDEIVLGLGNDMFCSFPLTAVESVELVYGVH